MATGPVRIPMAEGVTPEMVAELPERQREVYTAVVIDGLGYADASERIGIPQGSISSNLANARRTLEQRLAGAPPRLTRNRNRPTGETRSQMLRVLHDEPEPPLEPWEENLRPRTRGDCADGSRPCPWASCSMHLALDVNPRTGHLTRNQPSLEVWEMNETCALDLADKGGMILQDVGDAIGVVRERVRQVEAEGLAKIKLYGGDDLSAPVQRFASPLGEAFEN